MEEKFLIEAGISSIVRFELHPFFSFFLSFFLCCIRLLPWHFTRHLHPPYWGEELSWSELG